MLLLLMLTFLSKSGGGEKVMKNENKQIVIYPILRCRRASLYIYMCMQTSFPSTITVPFIHPNHSSHSKTCRYRVSWIGLKRTFVCELREHESGCVYDCMSVCMSYRGWYPLQYSYHMFTRPLPTCNWLDWEGVGRTNGMLWGLPGKSVSCTWALRVF